MVVATVADNIFWKAVQAQSRLCLCLTGLEQSKIVV